MDTISPPVNVKVATQKVTDRVTDLILTRIAAGEWALGDKLPGERTLAEQLGVSRVSVRSALQTLKTQGYVDAIQGGGTRVISNCAAVEGTLADLVRLSPTNLYDLSEIRGIIEVWAARRAAITATPDQIRELEEITAAAEREGGARRAEYDLRFHLAVAKASNSEVYIHLLSTIRGIFQQMLDQHHYEIFTGPDDTRTVLAHHRAVTDAITSGDSTAAALAMQIHLSWVVARHRRLNLGSVA